MTDSTRRPDPRQVRRLVAGLVLLAVASLLPDFRPSVLPRHDARQTLSALQILASGLRGDGEIPQWLPYGRYGNSSFLVLLNVTPAAYATVLASSFAPAAGAVGLLKIATLLELLVFLAGSIRLSLLLFRELPTVALVNVGAILSFSWLSSLDANFHTFYLLPFILDALLRFSRDGRVAWLLTASLFCVVSAIGNVPYYPPMMALMLTIFCAVLLWRRGYKLPPLVFSKIDALLAVPLVVLAAAHAGGYILNFRDQHTYTPGRDPVSGKVLLHFFLEYNGVTTIPNLAKVFITGAHTHGDVTFYIGLAPLAFAFLGLSRCRRPEFLAVAAVAGFLVLFSFGGLVARAAYYFPGMCYYRHIGLVFGQVKYLLLLMAGFGLDAQLSPSPAEPGRPKDRIVFGLAGLIAVADLVWSFVRTAHPWNFQLLPETLDLPPGALVLPAVRVAIYGILLFVALKTARLTPVAALLAAFLVDVGSFKLHQYQTWPAATVEEQRLASDVYAPRPTAWQPQRTAADHTPALRFAAEEGVDSCVYSHVYSVLGVDPRMPEYRVDTLTTGLDALFRARGVEFRQFPRDGLLPADDLWLLDALGARAPKLRVCPASALDVTGSADAVRALPRGSVAPVVGTVRVTSFGFNRLAAEATVDGSDPAWLYYADADHPGWSATLDDKPVAITKANLAFKAVPLHAGLNRVEFRYWNGWGSLCLPVLAGGSVLSLIALAAYLLRSPAAAGT